jgi:hypothetical protein
MLPLSLTEMNEIAGIKQSMRALRTVTSESAFFYGPSAVVLWNIPLPAGLLEQLHLAVLYPASPIRRVGVTSTRMRPHLAEIVDGNEFRALSAATTWASLAPFLNDDDLVAAADCLLCPGTDPGGRHPERVTPPVCTVVDLREALARGRWPHGPRLRRALERARVGSKSRRETQVRLGLAEAGLPEPELNQDVWEDDQWLACPDFVYRRYKVCIEYQSAYHRSAQQYDADIDRRRRLQAAGWLVVELTSTHVARSPRDAVRRVAEALRQRGWSG